jgi:hypothetical protein
MKRGAAIAGTLVILLNAVVTLAHDEAHSGLGVELSAFQNAYAYTVIVGGPLLALALLWTPWIRQAGLLLALAMAGSLAFAAFFHYVHVSPDHVDHLPEGDAQGLFRLTAMLMIPAQALGIATGLAIWRRAAPAGNKAGKSGRETGGSAAVSS